MTDNGGWIYVFRKIMEWEWYHDSKMVHLFLHLIFMAQYKSTTFRGIELKRGQLLTGRAKLSSQTGLSEQSIRTCLDRLISSKEVTSKPTNRFSVITIVNYETYQKPILASNQPANQQTTNKQPASNHIQVKKESKKVNKTILYSADSVEIALAQTLSDNILERFPDRRSPDLQKWARPIDLMIRVDKIPAVDIRTALEWIKNDPANGDNWPGWGGVILSTSKLREKWDTISARMGSIPKQSFPKLKYKSCYDCKSPADVEVGEYGTPYCRKCRPKAFAAKYPKEVS